MGSLQLSLVIFVLLSYVLPGKMNSSHCGIRVCGSVRLRQRQCRENRSRNRDRHGGRDRWCRKRREGARAWKRDRWLSPEKTLLPNLVLWAPVRLVDKTGQMLAEMGHNGVMRLSAQIGCGLEGKLLLEDSWNLPLMFNCLHFFSYLGSRGRCYGEKNLKTEPIVSQF